MNGQNLNTQLGAPECCGNCKFFRMTAEKDGMCIRQPPTPLALTQALPDGEVQIMIRGFHAPVVIQGWCGEYRRALKVATPADVAKLVGARGLA